MPESTERAAVGPDIAAFLRQGVSLVVATRNEDLRPAVTRGWGAAESADGSAVTVCLPAAPGSEVRANLESNGAVAISCTLPSSYRSVQIKGTAIALAEPTAEQLALAEDHITAFVEETRRFGDIPPSQRHRVGVGPLDLALTFAVEELFDQTPGPAAGTRL
jgi:hypothetical protein